MPMKTGCSSNRKGFKRYDFYLKYFAGLQRREVSFWKRLPPPTPFGKLLEGKHWLELAEHIRRGKRIGRNELAHYFRSLAPARGRRRHPVNEMVERCVRLAKAAQADWRRENGRRRVPPETTKRIVEKARADLQSIHGKLPATLSPDEVLRQLSKRSSDLKDRAGGL
jgi:hypothetical protein